MGGRGVGRRAVRLKAQLKYRAEARSWLLAQAGGLFFARPGFNSLVLWRGPDEVGAEPRGRPGNRKWRGLGGLFRGLGCGKSAGFLTGSSAAALRYTMPRGIVYRRPLELDIPPVQEGKVSKIRSSFVYLILARKKKKERGKKTAAFGRELGSGILAASSSCRRGRLCHNGDRGCATPGRCGARSTSDVGCATGGSSGSTSADPWP